MPQIQINARASLLLLFHEMSLAKSTGGEAPLKVNSLAKDKTLKTLKRLLNFKEFFLNSFQFNKYPYFPKKKLSMLEKVCLIRLARYLY